MRIDKNDNPCTEVNANHVSPDSGLVAATTEAGLPITEVLRRIISDLIHSLWQLFQKDCSKDETH
jgi:hypothetical protein